MQTLQREKPFHRPIRFLQFGEGNFLRAFVDWQIDLLNERTGLDAGVVVVRPRGNPALPLLDVQGGMFTTLIRGLDESGQPVKTYRKIECVEREIDLAQNYAQYLALAANPDLRFVVSNTTEAGIATNDTDRFDDAPASTFPAKLTRFLHARFTCFDGAADKGLVLLPCELIDYNGEALKAAVLHFARLWQLGAKFEAWLTTACTFCSTLVDRIVTGYPHAEMAQIEEELGYKDQFLVTAEYFYLFVIQGPQWLAKELKLDGAGLNIRLVDDITPYKQRKVGVLNGGHTTLVPVALLAGLQEVGEAVADPVVGPFLLDTLNEEIIPALPLERSELDPFAADVLRRFRNPYIHHRLESIALNSWSKYAARVLPQLLQFQRTTGKLPRHLLIALAATMVLYRGKLIKLSDDPAWLAWFDSAWAKVDAGQWTVQQMATEWLGNIALWGQDLNGVAGLTSALGEILAQIDSQGIAALISRG
ncbi:tagaturonate reductase [Silvimonas iriomotensis]|uniref:Altronate oxidoreductase n=1 Tax=Silvimonas iriomotensis TaxID=449662 RepID=A0ABQ2P5A4_9NEIS|nr:tagaturonate reductase [Silvimonas iriomotensis]GGP18560.1 altronate oxidoreductase [Silvimonas iriomotensis]